jgi:AraC-like DNA-binding protein
VHHSIEGVPYEVEADQIAFTYAYYSHGTQTRTPCKQYVIAVPAKFSKDVDRLFEEFVLPPVLTDKQFNKTVKPYFECMVNSTDDTPNIITKGYVNLIFGLLFEHYKNNGMHPKHKNIVLIADILEYIDKHYEEPLTLMDLAEHFGYNKSYFSRFFNKHVGVSLNDYINGLRMDRYEELAKLYPDKSVTDIVFLSGFQSLATFYRVKDFRDKSRIKHE